MWMSEILIVVNQKNVDRNGLHDIAGAVKEMGAQHVAIDEDNTTLTATMASSHVPDIRLIEGVTYIRPTLTWFKKTV